MSIKEVLLSVPYKDKIIKAKIDALDQRDKYLQNQTWIVLTHGAGGDLNTPQLASLASFLARSGFIVFRFTCKGLNIKHRINVFAEMLKYIFKSYSPKGMFIGGRSMGARTAAMLTVKDLNAFMFAKIMGIICLSYPLHKVNCLNELRDEPLKESQKPLFFLSGTKDEMCKKELLETVVLSLKCPYKIYWLHGCNHSAKLGKTFEDDIYIEAFEILCSWCRNISEKI